MINGNKLAINNPIYWLVFLLYTTLLGFGILHHELWGDEIHSWNIAKGSTSFFDLISNIRYEGHPPIWYIILWTISKYTHNLIYMQLVQFLVASSITFLILFFFPFSFITKILIPFGYYFLFEYGMLSRNYAIGILLAFCICLIIKKEFKYKIYLYYLLLLLICYTHLLAILLAGSLHLYFLILNIEQKKKISIIALHAVIGIIIFLPSLYFIFPPSDSELNISFWTNRWNINQLSTSFTSLLRSFIPIPAWWKYNFWNTQFLIEAQNKYTLLKAVNILLTVCLLGGAFFLLKKNKKSLFLFIVNLILTLIISIIFPLFSARYVGFIYIGFLISYFLYCYETTIKRNNWFINSLLIIQSIAGFFSISKDIQLPFSNAYKVNELLKKVPQKKKIVTDYRTLNTVSAFVDKPFYCIELQKEISFLLWNNEIKKTSHNPYILGIKNFFQKNNVNKLYIVSIQSPKEIFQSSPQLLESFKINLIDKREGSIEKSGNVYLYEISL